MKNLSILAPAKINLYLDVLNKREDGYHNIKSIMQSISLYDKVSLSVFESDFFENEIEISSNDTSVAWDESNLVYKGASLFIKSADIHNKKLVFFVEKNIPVCAGMAGGSADVGAALILLNEAFKSCFSLSELCALGAKIGADVPFCITKGTCICEGIGEKITSLPTLDGAYVVCGIGALQKVSTPYAYKTLDEIFGTDATDANDINEIVNAIKEKNLESVASLLYNKFEAVATSDVDKIKSILISNGALGSLMSGSGPSVFGIFPCEEAALNAFSALKMANFKAFLCKTV